MTQNASQDKTRLLHADFWALLGQPAPSPPDDIPPAEGTRQLPRDAANTRPATDAPSGAGRNEREGVVDDAVGEKRKGTPVVVVDGQGEGDAKEKRRKSKGNLCEHMSSRDILYL